ncbi:MAG: di-heme enzyme [Armatimonadetes bacterium]|nr:di-heme enzyme [Armatimonadota bacterium]
MKRSVKVFWFLAPLTLGLALGGSRPVDGPYDWKLPVGFPTPIVPADNPMTAAKVELGRHLFFDKRLSGNGTQSCASCHRPDRAFADDRPVTQGSTGEPGVRNPMSLVNVAYAGVLTWSNPGHRTLEAQVSVPLFGTHPVELGAEKDAVLKSLESESRYGPLFAAAFPGHDGPYTIDQVSKALACFQRSLISAGSPYDRYRRGEIGAISEAAKRGEFVFVGPRLDCARCHGEELFTDTTVSTVDPAKVVKFHNNGLYNVQGPTSYPQPSIGVAEHTKRPEDMGKFKAPSLRNIALTAPYMHDGSIATLEGVVDHYAAGGRTIKDGPHAGVGRDNPNKDPELKGFRLFPSDKEALIAFLESLTDPTIATNPAFSDPWTPGRH